jgi:hypothetical protein
VVHFPLSVELAVFPLAFVPEFAVIQVLLSLSVASAVFPLAFVP